MSIWDTLFGVARGQDEMAVDAVQRMQKALHQTPPPVYAACASEIDPNTFLPRVSDSVGTKLAQMQAMQEQARQRAEERKHEELISGKWKGHYPFHVVEAFDQLHAELAVLDFTIDSPLVLHRSGDFPLGGVYTLFASVSPILQDLRVKYHLMAKGWLHDEDNRITADFDKREDLVRSVVRFLDSEDRRYGDH